MVRVRPSQAMADRQGVILLVVITLLTLFAVVGITFVIYAQAEASSMRVARQAETLQLPDADPELLLAYYLNQLIYGPPDGTLSAMRNWDLARNMYGQPGSPTAFSGFGRFPANLWKINYGNQPNNAQGDADGIPNPAYTYPDVNNLFLSAVRASDGGVLIPSFYRNGGPNGPANLRAALPFAPEDGFCDVKNLADSPGFFQNGAFTPNDSIWMDLGFPVMAGPDGRMYKPLFASLIQDLDNRVNVNAHGFWFINPHNGAVNPWNATANWSGASYPSNNKLWGGLEYPPNVFTGNQGWGVWETRIDMIVNGTDSTQNPPTKEAAYLFGGSGLQGNNAVVPGRYDSTFWGSATFELANGPAGHYYNVVDFDGPFQDPVYPSGTWDWFYFCNVGHFNGPDPSGSGHQATAGFFTSPLFGGQYHNGSCMSSASREELYSHPMLYNLFSPKQNCLSNSGGQAQQDRRFGASHMEALLRYSDTGSPGLTSDLFRLCPNSFGNPKTRRLVTTHSYDVVRPGVPPYIWDPTAQPYTLAAGQLYPTGNPVPAPTPGSQIPANSEFMGTGTANASWASVASALNRVDLNRTLPNYPSPDTTKHFIDLSQAAIQQQYNNALQARQQMAKDIFTALWTVTGAGNPANATPPAAGQPSPSYDALRWLAQLAVNIVDYIDNDDFMTPFNWNPAQTASVQNGWVFGTELPRCVVNEVYSDVVNDPNDPGLPNNKATTNYRVRFWVELHNPMSDAWDSNWTSANDPSIPAQALRGDNGSNHPVALTEYGKARLQVPASGNNQSYACYQVWVCTASPADKQIRNTYNVLGDPDPNTVKLVVSDFTPDPNANPNSTVTGDDQKVVWPFNGGWQDAVIGSYNSAPNNGNTAQFPAGDNVTVGFFLLGPSDQFPDQNVKASVCIKPQQLNGQQSQLFYTIPAANDPTQVPNHSVFLRRLACPYVQPNNTPGPGYNPYVTVDYLDGSQVNFATVIDGVQATSTGMNNKMVQQANAYSVGKQEPYRATALSKQNKSGYTQLNQPSFNHTFLLSPPDYAYAFPSAAGVNNPTPNPYQWLTFNDRPVAGVMDLLHVSGFKPHELTQQFMLNGNPAGNSLGGNAAHLAPWAPASPNYNPNSRIFRLLELLEGGYRYQWSPIGGRTAGKININTIWDQDTFNALCGARVLNSEAVSFFTPTDVNNAWTNLMTTRSPQGAPGPNDQPFKVGSGNIQDTLFRTVPNSTTPIFWPNFNKGFDNGTYNPSPTNAMPWLNYGMLRRLASTVTTRSNVFAVWLTVGFFEVTPNGLGQELNKAEGRNLRHRMFAIIDRTSLSLALGANNTPQVGMPGPPPFFLDAQTAAKGSGQPETITVPLTSGTYEDSSWSITQGMPLVVDSGQNQEVVTVAAVGPNSFTAVFTKPHPIGFAVSNAMLGHPGPQPFFDPRNPKYSQVVRYFSVIN